ncbi:endoribonuclease Dcr-1 [Cylas formicarius]|uniref:endoribonuclease Dcr-1 n=1 Tax=Cylas formicarius TaxID=197179 RepID=UPI002958B997|nr:endoribonuclease Dcr-1 [Cylas formicarius]
MACYINENVYTHTFTPREYQVELLDSAKKRNTIVCSSTSSSKAFIVVKLLQELSYQMRGSQRKKALLILDPQNVHVMVSHVKFLTDLSVVNIDSQTLEDINRYFEENQVIVTTAEICISSNILLDLKCYNLLVIDDCLYGKKQIMIKQIMSKYNDLIPKEQPRILGLTTGLLGSELQPERLEAEFQRLEKLLNATVDTSSEIVTLVRLSCHPRESIIQCTTLNYFEVQEALIKIVQDCEEFIKEHRYDPSEIYEDEFLEEYKDIPDPKITPLELLHDYLSILEDLGPWGADRAAMNLLSKIEKLKVKTPYERHYLLLCTVSTTLVRTRAVCDYEFEKCDSEIEKIKQFSTLKVMKLIDVLRQFKPAGEKPRTNEEDKSSDGHNSSFKKTKGKPRRFQHRPQFDDMLCALIFVENRYKAKALFGLLCTLSQFDDDFWWVSALFSVEKVADIMKEPHEAEREHKIQEEVLRKFRCHECNILISTSVLEQGCDLPKCNLVIRFDLPTTFHSYIQCKARARAPEAHYILFAKDDEIEKFVTSLAEYNEVENTLLKRCSSLEPDKSEEQLADSFSKCCKPYQPLKEEGSPSVTLFNSIPLVNKYCAKLPSDTFTRLTPIWYEEKIGDSYVCHIRLPINSPVKQVVTSPPMPNSLLSRRAAAFMVCQYLHKAGELDNQLQPINKENFVPAEEDWNNITLDEEFDETSEVRPGTTKRRQYYYKKVADALVHCHPIIGQPTYFYQIVMTLTCPLPEEQNTRGRKIYPPEESPQGFGILTNREIPKISAFPIFTRSGEVEVELQLCSKQVIVDEKQTHKIQEFVNYTFTTVLRLQKYLMLFKPELSDKNYLIVPTIKTDKGINIDWDFIDLIYDNLHFVPKMIPDEDRKDYKFNIDDYKDAVVMPWYRNQDQPQYFYVAEICSFLNPTSAFPGSEYKSFEQYYLLKYDIQIQNLEQYLLDVDHTSARLNFLTPRYVNRKGVALPTSSEETKRAKRENLEQKQILVPELCSIHPFSASLWRKAVALPCVLYRINALLLADQIRTIVASHLNLGKTKLDDDFKWTPLNFGWSLSDVLKKSREDEMKKQEEKLKLLTEMAEEKLDELKIINLNVDYEDPVKSDSNSLEEEDEEESSANAKWVVGTWSNDMAQSSQADLGGLVRYVSPTSWLQGNAYDDDFSDDMSDNSDMESEESSHEWGRLRIEFTGDHQAEALDDDESNEDELFFVEDMNAWQVDDNSQETDRLRKEFTAACLRNKEYIWSSGILIKNCEEFEKKSQNNLTKDILPICPENFDFDSLMIGSINADQLPSSPREPFVNTYLISEEQHNFTFDEQPNLDTHPGPSPNVLLQALTMSNANDGINLERQETVGDSFLKYAITTYLYKTYENIHEGKLSHLRSKHVSNLNLYKLGKLKNLAEYMVATKFDPHDNWLPPCFYVPKQLEDALIDAQFPANCWTVADMAATRNMTIDEICTLVRERGIYSLPNIIPYNLVTQHSIPDKSIADCVEALIGAYLIECGSRGALLFMAWLGIKVLPKDQDGNYGHLDLPKSPLLRNIPNPEEELEKLLDGYDAFEKHIGYKFRDRAYLLQAFTHASYSPNRLTDCYQRLEFLGDALLDFIITKALFEDVRMHSPGALTDLRSALVNNTIFASLAVKHGFHKYFKHLSPGLNEVIERFVRLQEESGHTIVDEHYLIDTECEEVEDIEVPKALGDVFESVAGAIYLDSGMSLDAVWRVYYRMMKAEIEQFSNKVPKSPIRELLELEPETAKFGRPEKLADGRRVRVTVQVFGKGTFKGIGRNYRIAKCTAAKCALKHLKRRGLLRSKNCN